MCTVWVRGVAAPGGFSIAVPGSGRSPRLEKLPEMVARVVSQRVPHDLAFALVGVPREPPAHQLAAEMDEKRVQSIDFAVRPDPLGVAGHVCIPHPGAVHPSFPGKPSICAISSSGANARVW